MSCLCLTNFDTIITQIIIITHIQCTTYISQMTASTARISTFHFQYFIKRNSDDWNFWKEERNYYIQHSQRTFFIWNNFGSFYDFQFLKFSTTRVSLNLCLRSGKNVSPIKTHQKGWIVNKLIENDCCCSEMRLSVFSYLAGCLWFLRFSFFIRTNCCMQ